MSDNSNVSILFMDDEPSAPIIKNTRERLEKEGFDVDFTESMASAIEQYYNKYYDVFILDIDMQKTTQEEADGVNVLKRFISLHNETKVIMFSGAGTVDDWFESVNSHCYAYIAKDLMDRARDMDSIDLLVEKIKQAVVEDPEVEEIFEDNQPSIPPIAKIYCQDDQIFSKIQSQILTILPDWELQRFKKLSKLQEVASEQSGLVVLARKHFSSQHSVFAKIADVINKSDPAKTIVLALGDESHRESLLKMVNLHPFRMHDLKLQSWTTQLTESIEDAVSWYGKREIFKADMEALQRLKIELPSDIQESWEEYPEDDDDPFDVMAAFKPEDKEEE